MPGFFLAKFHVEPDSGADVSEAVRNGGNGPPLQPVLRNFLSEAQGTSHQPSRHLFFSFLDLDFWQRDLPQAPGSSNGDPIPGSDGPGLEAIFGATGDAAVLVARLMGIENAISPQKLGKRVVPLSLAGHGTADFASSAAVRPESEACKQQIPDAASPSVHHLALVSLTSAGNRAARPVQKRRYPRFRNTSVGREGRQVPRGAFEASSAPGDFFKSESQVACRTPGFRHLSRFVPALLR